MRGNRKLSRLHPRNLRRRRTPYTKPLERSASSTSNAFVKFDCADDGVAIETPISDFTARPSCNNALASDSSAVFDAQKSVENNIETPDLKEFALPPTGEQARVRYHGRWSR